MKKLILLIILLSCSMLCFAEKQPSFEEMLEKAKSGDSEAQSSIGVYYFRVNKNYRESFRWFKKAAEQGHTEAQFLIGCYYKDGSGVDKNSEKSFLWTKKAAENNLDIAQFYIGFYYKTGFGVKKNAKKAFKWFKKAAELGNVTGMEALGSCYENGIGVEKNEKEALKWYKKVDDMELEKALQEYKELSGFSNMFPTAKKNTIDIDDYCKAIELNPDDAKLYLKRGDAFFFLKIWKQAIKDYKKAIKLNPQDLTPYHTLAFFYSCYEQGSNYVSKSEALKYAKKAVKINENESSLRALASVYARAGLFEKALKIQKRALKLEPNNKLVKQYLEAYKEQKNCIEWDNEQRKKRRAVIIDHDK